MKQQIGLNYPVNRETEEGSPKLEVGSQKRGKSRQDFYLENQESEKAVGNKQ